VVVTILGVGATVIIRWVAVIRIIVVVVEVVVVAAEAGVTAVVTTVGVILLIATWGVLIMVSSVDGALVVDRVALGVTILLMGLDGGISETLCLVRNDINSLCVGWLRNFACYNFRSAVDSSRTEVF
jgi:hypothetical protein